MPIEVIIIIVTVLFFAFITWFIGRFFETYRFFRLIPAFVALVAAFYNIYLTDTGMDDAEYLARVFITAILLIGALSGVITAFVIDRLIPLLSRISRK